MFGKQSLLKQRAKQPLWFCALGTLFVGGGAALLWPPLLKIHPLLLGALALGIFALIRFGYGLRSGIVQQREQPSTRELWIQTPRASMASYLPLQNIFFAEVCDYRGGQPTDVPAQFAGNPYHMTFTQWGYTGKGLTIGYRSPPNRGGDNQERYWQFPAPHAEEMLRLLQETD